MSRKLMRLLAVIFALALVASACGSDDAEEVVDAVDDAADAVDDATDDATSLDDSTEVEDGGVETTPIAELEAQWAEERQAIIDDIIANGYGRDGDTVTGPAGMTIDLSACPADWDDAAGINDGVITIGHTIAQSGSLASYGNIATGMTAYFDYINEQGGIGPDGLQIEHIVKDDAYVATQTQELVAELLQTEDPFYITTLGSPNTFSVQGTLNDNCVPQVFAETGHQAWGDPVNNPWTTGLQMSYAAEALLWGSWIEQNMEPGTKVAALVMDNDFGLAYEQGFADFADASDVIESVDFVRHDPAAATLTNEITTLAASEPDVFISMTAGNPCLLAVQEAARAGITAEADAFFMPSVCKGVSAYMAPAGEAADGWLIFGGGWKDNTDPQYENDTYISWMNDQIEAAGLDNSISLTATGYGQFGWSHVQALEIAANLPGGLTRTNFMIAQRSLCMDHPGLLEGIAFCMNGAEDAYLVEGSDLSRFEFDTQSWNIEGGVIDLNGESPNCAWVAGEGC